MPARKNRPAAGRAPNALDRLKYEIAQELRLPTDVLQRGDWGSLSSRQCGAVGGRMVKRMIEAAEKAIAEQAAVEAVAGFRSGLELPRALSASSPPTGPHGDAQEGQT